MQIGLGILLLTDLEKTFVMDADAEFEQLMALGYFRAEGSRPWIFMRVNEIVNQVIGFTNSPSPIKQRDTFYAWDRRTQEHRGAASEAELQVLAMLREPENHSVTVRSNDGHLVRAEVERVARVDGSTKRLVELLEGEDFQTVTVKRQDRTTVSVTQKIPRKFTTKDNQRGFFRVPPSD